MILHAKPEAFWSRMQIERQNRLQQKASIAQKYMFGMTQPLESERQLCAQVTEEGAAAEKVENSVAEICSNVIS